MEPNLCKHKSYIEENTGMIVHTSYQYHKTKTDGKTIINGVFTVLETIGSGAFWKVIKVKRNLITEDTTDTNFYVFKEGKLGQVDGDNYDISVQNNNLMHTYSSDFSIPTNEEKRIGMKEFGILKFVNHKNIARLYECIIDIDSNKIVFVMEYCDLGQLMCVNESQDGYKYNMKLIKFIANNCIENESEYNYLENDPELNFITSHKFIISVSKFIFFQLAEAIKYLHDSYICHRDIKPDNILMKSEDKNIKLIDFSISVQLKNQNEKLISMQGTEPFKSPEVLRFEKHNPFKVDIYNYGATFYVFLFSRFEYDFYKTEDTKILRQTYPLLYDLLVRTLNPNPDLRPEIDEILADRFFD